MKHATRRLFVGVLIAAGAGLLRCGLKREGAAGRSATRPETWGTATSRSIPLMSLGCVWCPMVRGEGYGIRG